MHKRYLAAVAALLVTGSLCAAVGQDLPAPETGGRPLMDVLGERRSGRDFSDRALPPQELSNLLWAAFGINRPESGKRTAPSALNWQEIDVYVTTADGLFRYEAKGHSLEPIHDRDIRALTGRQAFPAKAGLNLVYVADHAEVGADMDPAERRQLSALDTGFIAQNVYLYCASAGLVTVARAYVDREALAEAMELEDTQWIVLAQTVGYPAE